MPNEHPDLNVILWNSTPEEFTYILYKLLTKVSELD